MIYLKSIALLVVLFVGASFVQTQDGPYGSNSVSEGSCSLTPSHSLLNSNLVWLLNTDLGRWYTPVGSAYFYRRIFEAVKERSADSQSELDAWNLNFTYLAAVESWSLYNQSATDICILLPNWPITGIPIFHCTLTVWAQQLLLGVLPVIINTIVQDFTIVWTDNVANMLCYRCQDGTRDWVVFTKDTTDIDPTLYNNTILPIVQSLRFNMSNIENMSY